MRKVKLILTLHLVNNCFVKLFRIDACPSHSAQSFSLSFIKMLPDRNILDNNLSMLVLKKITKQRASSI